MKTNDELTSGEIGVVTYVFILYLYDTVYMFKLFQSTL